jgi:hypothetical protein
MPDKQLEGTIRFWESKLQYDKYLMESATEAQVQQTVKYLKELQGIKEIYGEENGNQRAVRASP